MLLTFADWLKLVKKTNIFTKPADKFRGLLSKWVTGKAHREQVCFTRDCPVCEWIFTDEQMTVKSFFDKRIVIS